MLITFLVVPKSRSWRPITITNFVMLLIRKGSGSYSGEGTYKSVVITSGRYVFLCELLFRFSALENICSLLNTLWTSWHNLLRVLTIFKSKKALLALRLLRKFFTKILNTFDAQNFHENELTCVTSVIYTMHAVISEYEIILTNQLITKSIRGIVDLTLDINILEFI